MYIAELEDIRSRSLSSVIYRQLEEMILAGKIKPGERINESQLAIALQVSRAPIREACRQLEKHNIVEVRANRGTFVRNIDSKEVAELYDVRAALDALAGERAAERMTPAAAQELRGYLELMEGFTVQDNVAAYYRANLDFHMAVVRVSANNSLVNLYESVCKQALLFRRTSLSLPNRLCVSFKQHKEIFTALTSGQGTLAAALLKNHVLDAGRALVSVIESKKIELQVG
jgi:DNA-binding GntR family transcriptional regulator